MSTFPFDLPLSAPGEAVLVSIFKGVQRTAENGVSGPFFALLDTKDAQSLREAIGARNELLHCEKEPSTPPLPDWFPSKTALVAMVYRDAEIWIFEDQE